jgi:hypothetical protein
MLIDKYLPAYQFNEFHSIKLVGFFTNICPQMLQYDFRNSSLIKFLFRLRGMSSEVYPIDRCTAMGFVKLDEEPGKEIIFGIITDSPMFNTCQAIASPKEFLQNSDPGNIKAVINFRLREISNSQHIISTETRIWCGSKAMKSRFKYYWFFIKPFSQLIRKSMPKQMKEEILRRSRFATTP